MLGRFLEYAVPTSRLLESLDFYSQLGFATAADTGAAAERYVALGDGRLTVALHGSALEEPTLVFVCPGFIDEVERLEVAGLSIDWVSGGDHTFNRLEGRLPNGTPISLVDARTHSPLPNYNSQLGWFEEIWLPIMPAEHKADCWEGLGFVAFEANDGVGPRITLTSDTLSIGLHETLSPARPWLTFYCDDVSALRETLSRLGIQEDRRLAPTLDRATHVVLVAPEGTLIVARSIS